MGYGYMRESRLLFPSDIVYYDIPISIQHICLSFYCILEVFDTKNNCKDLVISGVDNNIITRNGEWNNNWNNAVYGSQWISSNQDNTIKWRFKILKGTYDANIGIGIVGNKHHLNSNSNPSSLFSFMYYGGGGKRFDYNRYPTKAKFKFKTGDEIDFVLDLHEAKIKIYKNNGTEVDEMSNLKKGKNIKYKLVISIHENNASIAVSMDHSDLLLSIPFCDELD